MERKKIFTVYKISGPTGKSYIGYTSQSLEVRWGQHQRKSKTHPLYPLYTDILSLGAENFVVETIGSLRDKEMAMQLEIASIAEVGLANLYNISRGGQYDTADAKNVLWERFRNDPEFNKEYSERLCAAQQKRAMNGDFKAFTEGGNRWRLEHPKEAYKIRSRATRVATKLNTTTGGKKARRDAKLEKPLKERLLEKYRGRPKKIRSKNPSESTYKSPARSSAVSKVWSSRTETEKEQIYGAISSTLKNKYTSDVEFKQANEKQISSARAKIDRSIQGPAASIGLKTYWAELKADPIKYAEYRAKRGWKPQ